MSVSALLIFIAVAIIDFTGIKKNISRKEIGLYTAIFLIFLVLCGLTYYGKIPPHFGSIIKIW